MIREDIRDISQIQEIDQLEMLSVILAEQVGQLMNYSSLRRKIRVSDQTIRRWLSVLSGYYYCFRIKPWHKNVTRSIIKDPKVYLWDWSIIKDKGIRNMTELQDKGTQRMPTNRLYPKNAILYHGIESTHQHYVKKLYVKKIRVSGGCFLVSSAR